MTSKFDSFLLRFYTNFKKKKGACFVFLLVEITQKKSQLSQNNVPITLHNLQTSLLALGEHVYANFETSVNVSPK